MKGGIGSFTVTLPGGVLVSALVAVNALGDVRDPATGKIVAGARKRRQPRVRRYRSRDAARRDHRAAPAATRRSPWSPPTPGSPKCRPPNSPNSPVSAWRAPSTRSTPWSMATSSSPSPSATAGRHQHSGRRGRRSRGASHPARRQAGQDPRRRSRTCRLTLPQRETAHREIPVVEAGENRLQGIVRPGCPHDHEQRIEMLRGRHR